MKTKIVVDYDRCVGCGYCTSVCKNAVLQVINGKAHVVNEKRCDVNGYCMQFCPADALSIQPKSKMVCEGDACCFEADSELYNWPVQITSITACNRYLQDSRLLIAADCAAYAYASFHSKFMRDHVVLIACPKNDLTHHLLEKCTQLFESVDFESIEVIAMNAPCCQSLLPTIRQAMDNSGKNYEIYERVLSYDGEVFE